MVPASSTEERVLGKEIGGKSPVNQWPHHSPFLVSCWDVSAWKELTLLAHRNSHQCGKRWESQVPFVPAALLGDKTPFMAPEFPLIEITYISRYGRYISSGIQKLGLECSGISLAMSVNQLSLLHPEALVLQGLT